MPYLIAGSGEGEREKLCTTRNILRAVIVHLSVSFRLVSLWECFTVAGLFSPSNPRKERGTCRVKSQARPINSCPRDGMSCHPQPMANILFLFTPSFFLWSVLSQSCLSPRLSRLRSTATKNDGRAIYHLIRKCDLCKLYRVREERGTNDVPKPCAPVQGWISPSADSRTGTV